jgi:hypothetical protein
VGNTTVEEVKKDAGELQAQMLAHITELGHRHVTLSYTVIGVLVLVLLLCGVGGYIGLRSYEAQMQRAEVLEKRYLDDRKTLEDQLTKSVEQRAADTQKQSVIVKVVHDRDTTTDAHIAAVTAPGKAPLDALRDLSEAYKGTIPVSPLAVTTDGQLVFPVLTVQGFTGTKLDRDRLDADLTAEKTLFSLEQGKTTTLTADLVQCKKTVDDAKPAIDAYKKIAKHSKLKKFFGGAAKVGIFLAGVYAGRKL